MPHPLANTAWKEIDARSDVLSLVDGQRVLLKARSNGIGYQLCWNSDCFTLTITTLKPGQVAAFEPYPNGLELSHWAYLQVDSQRPNYRILLEMGYDPLQQTLRPRVVKDAKLRFPGSEGDVRLVYIPEN